MNDDSQLLLRYAREQSESAFAELVQRHIDMVYSAALRVGRGDTYLAEDVAQIVFTELAHKAATLPREILLAGWLYRTASFTAVKAVRSERRRRDREQTAMQMIDQNDQTGTGWEQIAPDIDNALNQLNDDDRNAIVLRFLQRCDFRAVAAMLGVSEDAAQKRVSRALDKLRDILRPDPVDAKWTVPALASVLAGNAVSAAPAGLAGSIISASLTATTIVSASAGVTALKFMGMTKLQMTAAAAVLLGVVTTPVVMQQRSLNRMREENVALRQQAAEFAAAQAPSTNVQPSPDQAQLNESERVELLRLRNEVSQLRDFVFQVRGGMIPPPPNAAASVTQPAAQPDNDAIAQLGVAASRGDFTALDKLADLATASRKAGTNKQDQAVVRVDPAFAVLGSEAGKGNDTALQALWIATRNKQLAGQATRALGEAAGMGNEKALEPLLDPERFHLLLSSTVSALKPAADAGNPRAIDALAAVAANPKARGLWYMAAQGLEKAAVSGSLRAIEGLALIARSDTPDIRRQALVALENAAFKQHPAAAEALRTLGYQ